MCVLSPEFVPWLTAGVGLLQVDYAKGSITPPAKQASKTGRASGFQSPKQRRASGAQSAQALQGQQRLGADKQGTEQADEDAFPYRRQRQVM